MVKPIRRFICAGSLLLLTGLCIALARFLPRFWFSFYTDFSRGAIRAIGAVTGVVPFCLWQVVLVGLALWFVVSLIRAIGKKRMLAWISGVAEAACLMLFLFVGLWGLNHYGPDIGEQTGVEVREYKQSELKQAAVYYAKTASAYSVQVNRDSSGDLRFPSFSELSRGAGDCYARLGKENKRFANPAGRVKPLMASEAFAFMGTTGIYVCLTGEACVSTSDFILDQPFTMCHELGHSLAFAAEEEANYCAFLACRSSGNPVFLYSGYYNAFLYCYNALYEEDPKAAQALWGLCSEELIHDCNVQVTYDAQYEGKVQDAAQSVNDGYLKAMGEEGVKSYGMVVDYLIAEYLAGEG